MRFLDAGRECENAMIHGILGENRFAVAVFLKRDFQFAAVRQIHARAQTAFAAKAVEHPRNQARVATEFGGFAFETVNFLDDFNWHEHGVFFEINQ